MARRQNQRVQQCASERCGGRAERALGGAGGASDFETDVSASVSQRMRCKLGCSDWFGTDDSALEWRCSNCGRLLGESISEMSEMVKRVSFEMNRYMVEEMNDGTFSIFDGYKDTAIISFLTAAHEPNDVCSVMNARAAIAAMREPTPEMLAALQSYACCAGYVEEGWAAAIDQALK